MMIVVNGFVQTRELEQVCLTSLQCDTHSSLHANKEFLILEWKCS